MRHLDLFSGIGGFALAARWVGWKTIGFCEIEPFCRKILRKHWPEVRIYEDIKELGGQSVGSVDIITGGFPCQDISIANQKAKGIAGKRSGLWKEMARLVDEIRPRFVVVENVAMLLNRGIDTVLGDLSAIGYDAEWHNIPATAVGAPHRRERIWIVAYHSSERIPRLVKTKYIKKSGSWGRCGETDMRSIEWYPGETLWPKPIICRVDDGVSDRVDRIKGLGNSICPQVAEFIFRAIDQHMEAKQ